MEYFCVELKLNVYRILSEFGLIFGFPQITRPPLASLTLSRLTGGIDGFLQDMAEILPMEEFAELWADVSVNNIYLVRAIEKLKSDYFHTVALEVVALEEFQYMIERLEAVGLDAQGFLDRLKELLEF